MEELGLTLSWDNAGMSENRFRWWTRWQRGLLRNPVNSGMDGDGDDGNGQNVEDVD
jgi:hypothetical protein